MCWGLSSNLARMLSRALSGPFQGNTPALREACSLALDVLALSKPRICQASVLPPIVLLLRWSLRERGWHLGVGGCRPGLRSEVDLLWYGARGPYSAVARRGREQVICEIEAYALAITLFGLRGFVTGRSVIAFVDNDPCRVGFIKRYSPSSPMMGLIALVSLLEGALATTQSQCTGSNSAPGQGSGCCRVHYSRGAAAKPLCVCGRLECSVDHHERQCWGQHGSQGQRHTGSTRHGDPCKLSSNFGPDCFEHLVWVQAQSLHL